MNQTEVLGRNLASIREKRGLSQEALAEYLGISRVSVTHYESGNRAVPLVVLEKLADLFGVELSELTSTHSKESEVAVAFAFRKEDLLKEDLHSIGNFQRFVKNYLKMIRLRDEEKQGN